MENNLETLDFTGKKLKKLNKPSPTESHVSVLILDENELQRLDNIDSFTKVQKLSVVRNQLLRMYGVCRLHNLHTLNLAHNGILTIEGLKELVNLKYLCLTGNNIKTIEHLNNNVNLEHLDLSENNITYVSDLSFLKNLKELLLHGNRIGHLRQCDKYLPTSLTTLTLASNNIGDLNEVSQMGHLVDLVNFSISNNPCVNMTNGNVGFDYRPFIINWCMNVKVIDGYVVDAIESLRAEWLYSQGKGRHYRIGDHQELTQYLATVCPLTGETLETEEDRKLRLILTKAQQHQQQLREQLTTNGVMDTSSPSPIQRRRISTNNRNSPWLGSKFGQPANSPDRMTSSCYSTTGTLDSNSIMTQSLDPQMLSQTIAPNKTQNNTLDGKEKESLHQKKEKETNGVPPGYCLKEVIDIHSPLKAATKLVPVPESLMSPDYRPSNSLVHRLTPQTQSNLVQNNNRNIPKPREQVTGSPKLTRNSQTSKIQTFDNRKTLSPLRTRKNIPQPTNTIQNNEIISNNVQQKNLINTEDEADICVDKLQTIKSIVQERILKKNTESESCSSSERAEHDAAIFIQKMWRGYHARNKNKKAVDILKAIQQHRTEEYIQKLSSDMESTKAALESERKIQMLQMQAINALWKKVSTIQSAPAPKEDNPSTSIATGDNADAVKSLAHTCTMLNAQVQQLQSSMQDIMRCMTTFCQVPPGVSKKSFEDGIATQTEIIAVHTPQGEAGKAFPYLKTPNQRPSSLPLPVSQRNKQQPTTVSTGSGSQTEAPSEVKQFAGSLVEGVIKTVSETSSDCGGDNQDEDTITDDIIDTHNNSNENNSENIPTVQSECT